MKYLPSIRLKRNNKLSPSSWLSMQLRRTIYLVFALFITGFCHSQNLDFKSLSSSVLFKGDSVIAYRDPKVYIDKGTFYCYFTLVQIEEDGKIYMYTAFSKSKDLKKWSPIVKITPQSQVLDFSSPGNIIRYNDQYVMCL